MNITITIKYFRNKLTPDQRAFIDFYIEMAHAIGYWHAFNCINEHLPKAIEFPDRHYRGWNYFAASTAHVTLAR